MDKRLPGKATEQVRLDASSGSARDRPLPIRLIIEHRRKVTDNVDDPKYQTIL